MKNSTSLIDNQVTETEMWQAVRQFLNTISSQIAALNESDRQTLAALTLREFYVLPLLDLAEISEAVNSVLAYVQRWPDWPSLILRELGMSATDADRN